jgi:ketosteroid isomerase-like protein
MKKVILCLAIVSILISCDTAKKDNTQSEDSPKTEVKEMSKADILAKQSQETIDIANAYMTAMGTGDMQAMKDLMHEDMVWQNAGDPSLPWIGPWNGKQAILEDFFPKFGANFVTKKWEPNDTFANGDTAAYFGQMIGLLTNSDKETQEFTYALRVKVKDGKVILWNWFEDSYEVSRTYHTK